MRGIYVEPEAIREVDTAYSDTLAFNTGFTGNANTSARRIGNYYSVYGGAGAAEQ